MIDWPKVELPDDKFVTPCCKPSEGAEPPIERGIEVSKDCPGFWFKSPEEGEGIEWTVSHPIDESQSGSMEGGDPVYIVFDPEIDVTDTVTVTAKVYGDTGNTDLIGEFQETFSGMELQCDREQDGQIHFDHHCPTTEFSVQREGAVFEWDFGWDVYLEQDSDTANPTVGYVQPTPEAENISVSVSIYQNSDKSDEPEVLTIEIPGYQVLCEGEGH